VAAGAELCCSCSRCEYGRRSGVQVGAVQWCIAPALRRAAASGPARARRAGPWRPLPKPPCLAHTSRRGVLLLPMLLELESVAGCHACAEGHMGHARKVHGAEGPPREGLPLSPYPPPPTALPLAGTLSRRRRPGCWTRRPWSLRPRLQQAARGAAPPTASRCAALGRRCPCSCSCRATRLRAQQAGRSRRGAAAACSRHCTALRAAPVVLRPWPVDSSAI
jgi:hypothetical protein